MYKAKAYSAASATSPLASDTIPRRETTERDVQIEILFCGICHSDLHTVRNEWSSIMPTTYPCVPGHEIVGRVTRVGAGSHQIQAGRSGGGRLPGRFGPHLSQLPGQPGAVLPELDLHLQLPGQARYGAGHLRRLLGKHRRRRALRAARPRQSRSGRGRAAALRRHHHLLTDAPLGRHQREEGRRGRPRRSGAHGGQVRPGLRRPRGGLHHLSGQEGGCPPPRRP